MKKWIHYLPGVAFTAALAFICKWIAGFIPMHLISASVLALLIGMLLHPYVAQKKTLTVGFQFVSKKMLRVAIVLMGLGLSFQQVFSVGKYALFVMIFTLFSAYIGGHFLGKAFGMNWKLSSLISTGTGVCGGSAIAALAPTIEADDKDIAYAISATFLFDIAMVILFPLVGQWLNLTDLGFGLWTGTAVNDTSSVVAAAYAFSDAAGAYAVIVKLTRTLAIIPIVLIFSVIHAKKEHKGSRKVSIKKIFPYFILLFLVMVAFKSIGFVPDTLAVYASHLSKFIMIMALGAIGLKTNFKEMSHAGIKPMFHGFLVSALVVFVSLGVQFLLGKI